jgi:hypothetical protein
MINHEVGTDNKTLVARFIEYFSSLPSRSGSISEVGRGDQKSGSTRKDDVSLQRRIAELQIGRPYEPSRRICFLGLCATLRTVAAN